MSEAAYYVDRGPAYTAESLRRICADLGIWLVHTAPGDCEAKGAIERYHKTWRAEVGCELPDSPLTLAALAERHIAWITREYNRRVHGTTNRAPLEHFLAGCHHLRPVPRGIDFEGIFLHRVSRKVRSDELLRELHGLTSLDFDGRDYLTVWLVGHPLLARRLRLQQHAALAQRIVWYAPMVAKTDPQLFSAMLDHSLTAAAAPSDLISHEARDLILRVSRGIPRLISHLLRISSSSPTNAASPRSTSPSSTPRPSSSTSSPRGPPPCPLLNPASTATHGDSAT